MLTVWNRLEGRPRSVEFTRAAHRSARRLVDADPAMADRELHGTTPIPVLAQAQLSRASLTGYQARVGADGDGPGRAAQALVERRPLDLFGAGGIGAIDLRLAIGRRFEIGPGAVSRGVVAEWPFVAPIRSPRRHRARCTPRSGRRCARSRVVRSTAIASTRTSSRRQRQPWGAVSILDATNRLIRPGRLVEFVEGMFEH